MPPFCRREFCGWCRMQRVGPILLTVLLLNLRNIGSSVSVPLMTGGLATAQQKILPQHAAVGGKLKTLEMSSFIWGHSRVNSVCIHSRIYEQKREIATDTPRIFCVPLSSASSSRVKPASQPKRPTTAAAVQNLAHAFSDCSHDRPSAWLSASGNSNLRLPGRVRRRLNASLRRCLLSASGVMREAEKSFLPPLCAASAASTAACLLRWVQRVSRRLPVNQRAAECSSASSALLLWRSTILRKNAGFRTTLHSHEDDEDYVDTVEESVTSPVENADLDEDIERSQEVMTEGPQEASSKGKKGDFETAVTDEVLRGMVRSGFFYDEEADETMMQAGAPFIIDGPEFKGSSPFACPPWGPMKRMAPYDRNLARVLPTGDLNAAAAAAATTSPPSPKTRNATEGTDDFWTDLAKHTTNWDFYAEPGSRVQGMANGAVLVTPPITPNRGFLWRKHEVEQGAYEDPYADGTVRHKEPSYLNPVAAALRTGRRRDKHRRTDTGQKQKKRWGLDNIQEDIPRGNWTYTDDIYKDMLDSIDWEREWPHLHDKNYYKRSHYSTLVGDNDRNEDSYWDPQFIGGVDTYPRVLPAGANFNWPVYWVPWLCKKHPRRGGQPLKSELFNLGGVEPLQLWFYPDGCELSHPGFCSLKLVSRPGWNLPFKIKLWIQGTTVDIPIDPVFTGYSPGADAPVIFRGKASTGCREEIFDKKGGGVSGTEPGVRTSSGKFRRFVSRVEVGPVRREAADYVAYSTSFCRLLDKNSFLRKSSFPFPPFGDANPPLPVCFNPATDVVLGAAGEVEIGVAVAEDDWEWDDGHGSFEQWLKLQSAYPDDLELEETLPAGFTNSDMFENFKYRDVPDKHYAKYLPSALPPALEGEDFDQMALNHRHAY